MCKREVTYGCSRSYLLSAEYSATEQYTLHNNNMCTDSLSVLTAIVLVEPGLAGLSEAKDNGVGDDNWSAKSCIALVKSSPPTNRHPSSYRLDVLRVTQPTVSKH